MAKTLLVGMIEFTNKATFGGVNRGAYDQFEDALSKAVALMNDISTNPNDVRMFVAPEYYFSGHAINERNEVAISSLSRSDKHGLYKKIKGTSARYPGVLLVPGSIAYSKVAGIFKREHYNVCPIAAGGEIIHKYYKQYNDQYQSAEDFKTKHYGGVFAYKDLRFGVEICLDHGKKVLKTAMNGNTVDVQVLVSAGSKPVSVSTVLTEGSGVVVFCDLAGKGRNGILSMVRNQYNTVVVGDPGPSIRHNQALAQGAEVAVYQGAAG